MQVLCCYLVFEYYKQEDSSILPYLKSVPLQYDNIVNWTEEDLEYLPNFVYKKAKQLNRAVAESYEDIQKFVCYVYKEDETLINSMNYESYLWAWNTVNTRCVYMKQTDHPLLTDDENSYALAPFLDMLNHSGDVQVTCLMLF